MSGACPRCDGPIGCVECSPQTLKLRAKGRRLRKRIEELVCSWCGDPHEGGPENCEKGELPSAEDASDLEKLKLENQRLREELEQSSQKLSEACWPADHEKKDLPEDVKKLQALVRADEKKWQGAWRSSEDLRGKIREAYNEVISSRMASKMPFVFEMGTAVEDFLKEWFH